MGESGKDFIEKTAQTTHGALRARIDNFMDLLSQSEYCIKQLFMRESGKELIAKTA